MVEKLWMFEVFMGYENWKITFVYILVVATAQRTLVHIELHIDFGTMVKILVSLSRIAMSTLL